MTKNLSSLAAGAIALAVASSPALAGVSRTFVSGAGTDTGTCALTAPCRTFAYALAQTAPSGEIIVLSSAGYGTVTINQAVSIINVGYYAGVTVASGNGITINAGVNDSVVLRGISLDGGGSITSNGIVFNSGGKLIVDQCNLSNFAGSVAFGSGILLQPGSGTPKIILTNTTATNNEYTGIFYFPGSGSTAISAIAIDHFVATNNFIGIELYNVGASTSSAASISNTTADGNSGPGISLYALTTSIDASYASGNQTGITANSGTLALGRSVLMNNSQYGLNNIAADIDSYKDNRIAGNTTSQVNGAINPATLY